MATPDYLAKLLAPYRSAAAGTPTTATSVAGDPVYASLFPKDQLATLANQQKNDGTPSFGQAPPTLIALAKKLQRKGFDVSELEGFECVEGISSGHATNSKHYSGNAMDVNYYGGGKWESEPEALNWLAKWLNKRYDPDELFHPGYDPVGGHDSHLHFGL